MSKRFSGPYVLWMILLVLTLVLGALLWWFGAKDGPSDTLNLILRETARILGLPAS